MEINERSKLLESEKNDVFNLWNNEYPAGLSYNSIDEFNAYLDGLTEQSHLLLIDLEQKVKGWYFDFKRDDEKWFALLLDSKIHGKGYGSELLKQAKRKESELNGWVIDHNLEKKKNGDYYRSPLNFYLKNGFRTLTTDRLELGKISAVKIKWNNE